MTTKKTIYFRWQAINEDGEKAAGEISISQEQLYDIQRVISGELFSVNTEGITMTTLTTIEKAAKLMGYDHAGVKNIDGDLAVIKTKRQVNATWFNPYTSKSDLMDVENWMADNFMTTFIFTEKQVYVGSIDRETNSSYENSTWLADHPNKFTARAHAVMAVVEQIYDAKFGKDGE